PEAAAPVLRRRDRRHRVVDVDVLAREVPGFEQPARSGIRGRVDLALADDQALVVIIVAGTVVVAVAIRIVDRAATAPLVGRGDECRARTEIGSAVVVAGAVGVLAGTAEHVAERVRAFETTVHGQERVLGAGAADLHDRAVRVDTVHVPDQVRMLVVAVRRVVAAELLEPRDIRRPQRAAGAERTLAADRDLDAARVDVVLQRGGRREHDVAVTARTGAAGATAVLRAEVEHEQVGLVGTATRRRSAGPVAVLAGPVVAGAFGHDLDARAQYVAMEFHVRDRPIRDFRVAEALGERA